MTRIFTRPLGVFVALGVILTLFGGAQPASADPVPQTPRVASPGTRDGAGEVPRYRYDYSQLSKAKKADAQAASNIIAKATSKSAQILDYKKANKYDKGRTTARRQVAAGYLWAGKKVTHLTKTEKKKVQKYIPKKKAGKGFSDLRTRSDKKVVCEGKSGWVTIYDKYGTRRGWAIYLDSCETQNLKMAFYGVGFISAVVAIGAKQPHVSGALGTVAAICGLGGGIIETLAFYSTKHAIFFVVLSTPVGISKTAHPQ